MLSPAIRNLLLATSIGLLPARPADLKLKESDHRAMSGLVGDWFEAKDKKEGLNESMQKILKDLDSRQKRLRNEPILAAVEDWEQVFRLVSAGRLKGSLKKTRPGESTDVRTKHVNGIEIAFSYSLPKTYDARRGGPYPMILTIPDAGQSPAEHIAKEWSDPALRDAAIVVAMSLGEDASVWGDFGSPDKPGGVISVMSTVGFLQLDLALDMNRIFLAGAGKGWGAAEATAGAFPAIFAGLVGLGDVMLNNETNLTNFRNLPVLLQGGGEGAKAIEAKIGELGYGNCTAQEGSGAEAWAWMSQHTRAAYPSEITFSPTSDYAPKAYWISLAGGQASEGPHVEAKIDRESNTITVQADKVADIVIYLNDTLVDMSKPVRFLVNGTSQEQTVDRNAPEMINNQYTFGDWGRVFSGYVTQNVP